MPPRATAADAVPFRGDDLVAEVVEEFRIECRVIPGVTATDVWFRDPAGPGFIDATGLEVAGSTETEHPAHQAIVSGRPVTGRDVHDGGGVAYPVRQAPGVPAVAWFAVDEPTRFEGDERVFLLDGAVQRLSRQLGRAVHTWSDERRRTALGLTREGLRRFRTETSLHRALRLDVADLADLAGADEVSVWRHPGDDEPVCLAQVRAGSTSAERHGAVQRLVTEVLAVPTPLRVTDTAASPHFAWCGAEGIGRFLARPLEAYDRVYGVILVVDYSVNPPLSGLDPSPGLEDAVAMLADGAASAFHQISLHEDLTRLDGDLRSAQRLVERAERESVLFELSRGAANALTDATEGLLSDLPEVEEPVPEDEYRARMARMTVKLRRVGELLDEFRSLTSQSPARLRNVDLGDVIYAAVEELRQAPGAHPANVSLRLQGDMPALLLDPDKIREVLVALVEHGVSGTEERHATISTRLQNEEAIVEVRVPDRSLPGGILESLFLPFAAADPAVPRHGLSLADQIVNEHGGQLRAKSDPEGGLLYWLSLPVGDNQDRRNRRADRRGRERRRDPLTD